MGEQPASRRQDLPHQDAQLLLAIFYDVLFALAGSDTPGCVAVHLRALDFDGRKPAIRQRFLRLIGSYLSLMALGLGYIWMLLDEESLAWQDHISQTFLSPRM